MTEIIQLKKRNSDDFDPKVGSVDNAIITTTWVTGTNFVTQDITVTGIKSTETPIVSVIYDGATKAEVEAQMTEANKIFRMVVSDDTITAYATEATTKELNIQVKRV